MPDVLLITAVVLQALAVAYGLFLLTRLRGAAAAWLFLLGAMLSMLVWRIVVVTGVEPSPRFNQFIGIWGSTCMVAAMFFFGREVTRRKRAEAERDALLDSERAARAEAERANRLKDEFLATLSHELRTPLAAILGWIEVVRLGSDAADTKRALETIERNARAQARLVEDLLDVTRMQAGALNIEMASVAFGAPVGAAIQSVRPSVEAKSIELVVRIPHAAPVVRGDAGRLQQVASNLLINAAKFTPRGGRITVTVTAKDGKAVLEVSDTGEGIDPLQLSQIFARFHQGDSSSTRRHGGLGLGLSIAKNVVLLHGGEIHAESAGRGLGSTFTVSLPLAPTDAPPAGESAPGEGPLGSLTDALKGLEIVLIDDEADVRTAVSRLLEQCGARVSAMADGSELEARLAAGGVDLLVIDIGMPNEDGYQLIRRIRRLPASKGGATPAISLTAHARSEDRARALDSGFQDHMPKPVDLPSFVAAIRAATDPRAEPSS